MRITFLGHAGFCVETRSATIVMDPWLTATGAFDSSWFQLPRNHHLAPLVQDKLAAGGRQKFVYISHEHKDHFDLPFLNSLSARDFTLVIGQFQRRALHDALTQYACAGLVACRDGEAVLIDGGYIKLYLDDTGLNRDSAILVRADGCTFLNLNDCKIYDRLSEIVRTEGPIDVLTCQFSGATWHPTCYSYPHDTYEHIARRKMFSKFESVAQAIRTVEPNVYVPSAGPACFLDPDLIHLNFESVNIFPRAAKFIDYLNRRLADSQTRWAEIYPGDELDVQSGEFLARGTERPDEPGFERYIRAYAAEYRAHFERLKAYDDGLSAADVLRRLRSALAHKLEQFSLRSGMRSNLYFGLTDLPEQLLEVDFTAGTVECVQAPRDSGYYRIWAPAWEVRRILDGLITWEDFSLSFRARLEREPDLYQTILQGFLILEADDLDWFCSRLVEIQGRAERTVVDVGARKFSIARYCPHQGGDLTQGRPEGSRLWVCARHGWQFDLEQGGRCTTNESTIDAVALEED